MGDDAELVRFASRCRLTIEGDELHDLPLGYRRQIWRLMGPTIASTGLFSQIAHQRRFELARHCIVQSRERWLANIEERSLIDDSIQLSNAVMLKDVAQDVAWTRHGEWWTVCDNLASNRPDLVAEICIAYGAVQLIAVALRDELFGDNLPQALTDADVDPDELDCSFCAAAAFAGGPVWSAVSNAKVRGEFWRWWLDTALLVSQNK